MPSQVLRDRMSKQINSQLHREDESDVTGEASNRSAEQQKDADKLVNFFVDFVRRAKV
jgi:hypothetical protein